MSDLSPRLGMPYLQPSQAQKHVTHNLALQVLDGVAQLSLQSLGQTTPPATPVAGEIHATGTGATGAWAGQDDSLAAWTGSGWHFIVPQDGWRAWALDSQQLWVRRDGSWQVFLDQVDRLGIGTAADQTNRLAVASDASLFSHAGSDHRMALNKAADADTASVLFQSGWTGHAEIGLAGETAFALKTSADGSAWNSVLRADPATQEITLAPAGTARMVLGDAGLQLDVPVCGTAVQADPTDATAGRLLTVGAFGLGAGSLPELADLNDATPPSGTYRVLSGTTVGTFPGATAIDGVCQVMADMAVGVFQTFRAALVTENWIRHHDGAVWSDWVRLCTADNVLGTVSQSGGVPTGAVIEHGSNANGAYLRLADGTQICWHVIISSAAGIVTWTYPAAWDGVKRLVATPAGVSSPVIAAIGGVYGSTCQVSAWEPGGNRVAANISLLAVGRWFN